MDWVEKYFELRHKRMGSKYDNPIDLYMAVFCAPRSRKKILKVSGFPKMLLMQIMELILPMNMLVEQI